MKRRTLLGALGATALAGCLSDSSPPGSDDDGVDGSTDGDGDGETNGSDDGMDDDVDDGTDDDADDGNDDADDGADDDEFGDPPEEPTIETTGSDCGDPYDDFIDVTVVDGMFVVEGVTPAPNPCHEAVLEAVDDENGQYSLIVDVRSTLEEGEACVQCHGAITYEVLAPVDDPDEIERVVVDHVQGERHEQAIE